MPNDDAVKKLGGRTIRFLFVDGDHTREGAERDINLSFPLLVPDSIVVFDDFRHNVPGLIQAIDSMLKTHDFERVFSYRNTLAIMI